MGGDSGIGMAVAIPFTMEGPGSFIAFLPDAEETKKRVEQQDGRHS